MAVQTLSISPCANYQISLASQTQISASEHVHTNHFQPLRKRHCDPHPQKKKKKKKTRTHAHARANESTSESSARRRRGVEAMMRSFSSSPSVCLSCHRSRNNKVFSNTRIVRAAGSSNGSNANNISNNNNASDSNNQNNKKRAHRVRSTMSDFQQQQKPYTSYREKHGYNWTYGSAEDDENAEYGTSSSSSSSSSSPVSEADAPAAARNWLCTIGRQGQTSPIDFGKVEYDASRSKNVSENFRGTLLDDPFTNNPKVYEYMRARRGPMVGKLGKALRHVHGDEAYESYLGKHVSRHIRLARILKLWRINFHIRFGREPGYDDMPSNLKSLELQYINIGFKLRQLDG